MYNIFIKNFPAAVLAAGLSIFAFITATASESKNDRDQGISNYNQSSYSSLKGEPLEVMVARALKSASPTGLRPRGVGFFVDWDGHLVTASHVVLGCKSYEVEDNQGVKVDAILIGADSSLDIALLRADSTILQPFALENYKFSGEQEFNAVAPVRTRELARVTRVSVFGEINLPKRNVLRLTPALDEGNSGGPLYDNYGGVIAMVVGKWGVMGSEESIAVPGALLTNFLGYHRVKRIENEHSSGFGRNASKPIPDWSKIRESVATVTCKN